MSDPLKILMFDIETAPLLAHIWRPTDDFVPHDRILHDSFMLSWAAKWRGQPRVYSNVLTSSEARDQADDRIVQGLADLIRSADTVVAHNINSFDVPMLNNRLLLLNQEPLVPVRTIDTLTLARKGFRLAHNKLDYLAEILGHGRKIKTDFELWRQCYLGDEKALRKMVKYNRHDVVLLEAVFEDLLPYVRGLARLHDAEFDGEMACPYCGSGDLIKRGVYRTQAGNFQQWQCRPCQRYSRSRASDKTKRLGVHPL